MGAQLGVVSGQVAVGSAAPERRRDRWFVIGFGPTYYLKGAFGAPPLSTLVHVHGIVFTSWILLFLTQTSLIAAGRADLHRRLGVAGGVLAPRPHGIALIVAAGHPKRLRSPASSTWSPKRHAPLEVFVSRGLGGLVQTANSRARIGVRGPLETGRLTP